MSESRTALKLGCCAITTLISVILLGTSFAVLKPTQVGLWYNPTLNKMMYDSGIWENGRHILGPGHSFKSYSKKLKAYRWTEFGCWSKDKQDINLPITVFLRIIPEKIVEIHKKYGGGKNAWDGTEGPWAYWQDLISMTIREVSKEYSTTEYFENRHMIEANFTETLQHAFRNEHVRDLSVHMGAVQIPSALNDALVKKVVKQQLEITTQMYRNVTLVLAETEIIMAKADSDVTVRGAKAAASAKKTLAFAEADAFLEKQKAYAEGYKNISNSLGLDAPNLMRYIWARSLASASGNKELVVALDGKLPTGRPPPVPTTQPTGVPTPQPSTSPSPTPQPTAIPTPQPSTSPSPTPQPTAIPTPEPSPSPTPQPSPSPTPQPTAIPTPQPSPSPTRNPTA